MRIESSQPSSAVTAAKSATPAWRVGATVEVTVIRDATTGNLLLQHGNRVFLPRTRLPLREGDRWRARIVRIGPDLVLEVTDHRPAAVARRVLRENIAHQHGPAPLLGLLEKVEGQGAETVEAPVLPFELRIRLGELYRELPVRTDLLDGHGLRKALRASGLLYESLLNNGEAESNDMKGRLLVLASELEVISGDQTWSASFPFPPNVPPLPETMPEPQAPVAINQREKLQALLAQAVDKMLSRIRVAQASSLLHEGGELWIADLPWRDPTGPRILQLRIECSQEQDMPPVWEASFAIHSPSLGGIRTRLILQETSLAIQVLATRTETVARLEQYQDVLGEALQQAGLALTRCEFRLRDLNADTSELAPATMVDLQT